jgi:hypothetical protein
MPQQACPRPTTRWANTFWRRGVMKLADQLEDWTDLNGAQYQLGRTLGWFAGQSLRNMARAVSSG